MNAEIDKALDEYKSKSGGTDGNRPDAKLLLQDETLFCEEARLLERIYCKFGKRIFFDRKWFQRGREKSFK